MAAILGSIDAKEIQANPLAYLFQQTETVWKPTVKDSASVRGQADATT